MRVVAGRISSLAPWRLGLALSAPLAVAYLIAAPPSADLAAATYRSQLFSRVGFTLWDNGWYGGHHLPGYSVLAPALGALLSPRLCLAGCGVAAAACFGLLAGRAFPAPGARAASAWFAVGFTVELCSGRLPYDLGVVLGLSALLALQQAIATAGGLSRLAMGGAVALAVLTAITSPVAGAFLALTGVAIALATGARIRGAALAATALAAVLCLQVAFPEGGYEPFAPSAFWPALAATVAVAILLLRRHHRLFAVGGALYALASVLSFATHTAMGGNVARLGPLVAGPLLVGALWDRRGRLLAIAVPLLAYWSIVAPVRDLSHLIGDRSVDASYYAPLLAELTTLTNGRPARLEIPMTAAHWEADYVAARFPLARGWERQLDTRDAPLFYAHTLTAVAYRAWLSENAVAYVAVPDARLDAAGQPEARLIAAGLSYLTPVWHSAHWRLYAVKGPTPLINLPASLLTLGPDAFSLSTPQAATLTVRVRFTPYWSLTSGEGCVGPAPGGWTAVTAFGHEHISVGIRFAWSRVRARDRRCVD